MSNIVGSLKVLLGLDAAEFTSGLTRAEAVAAKFADKQKRNQLAIDRQVKSLQSQAAAYGMSTREAKLFELSQKGATAAQLSAADAALRNVEAQKEAARIGAAIGVGALAAVAGLVVLTKGAIDSADHLNDLSKKTGIAVETLGGIGFAAAQAGGDLDSAAAAVGKLNKSIAEARAGNKEAREAFGLLDLNGLIDSGAAADSVLEALAGRFAEFQDGPEKSALALRIFGKAGADIIPLLDEGAQSLRGNVEYFKRYSRVTAEVAAAADQFNDTQEKMNLLTKSFGLILAAELLPSLQAVSEEILRAKENGSLFETGAAAIRGVFEALAILGANVAFVFKAVGVEIGGIAAQIAALGRGDLKGFTAISDAMKADAERARAELDAFERRVLQGPLTQASYSNEGRNYGGKPTPKKTAPTLPDSAVSSAAAQALKKQLDGQIAAIRDFAEQQRDAYDFANRYVEGAYADGLISLEESLAAQKRVREAALAAQVQALDKEIALQRGAASKLAGADRIEAENKVGEAVAKRAQMVQRASQDEILAEQNRAAAVEQARRRYVDLIATIKELSGDTKGAAADRIAQQVADARKLITQSGGDPRQADNYGAALSNVEALRQAQDDYQKLLERSAAKEEEVGLAAQASGATEIETLRATGAARAKALTELSALVDKANELALSSNGNKDAIAFAERLGLAFKKASAEIDPLLQKVRGIGQELGQGLGDIFGEATRRGEGLKSILANIGDLVSQIATKELISKPLGDMFSNFLGGTGKDGGALGSLFGVGSGANGGSGVNAAAAATTTSFTTLQTIGIDPTVLALQRFQAQLSTTGATGSGAGGSGGGWVDLLAGLFGGGGGDYSYNDGAGTTNAAGISGGRANGGPVGAGGMFEVAEKRPELLDVNGRKFLLMGKQRGRIDPNPQVGGSTGHTVNANIVVQMPSGTSAQTMNQAGAAVARKLQMANRRNN
jgi:hypothetical protein